MNDPPDPPHPRSGLGIGGYTGPPVRKVRRKRTSSASLPLGCHPVWREIVYGLDWSDVPVNEYVVFIWGDVNNQSSRLGLKLDEDTVLTYEGPITMDLEHTQVAVTAKCPGTGMMPLAHESLRHIKMIRPLSTPEGW